VLCLQTCDRVHDWQETEKQLLNDISDQLAIALQQARLYQQLQQELQQRISLQEQLNYNASHDKLTGLGNREKLVKRLEETIQRYQSDLQGKFAVLFLDLNDFKSVNDTFGHTIGDQLLVVVAQRLKNCLREDDLVARFGGDEFVIILEHLENEQGAIEVVHRIHQAIAQSIIINQIELEITTSIGIVFSDPQYTTTDPILRDADIAMYEAKNSSAHYAIFEQ
jgi:diguanylate cyclase (GGDEF)-like protein